jgi:hypothetical protein
MHVMLFVITATAGYPFLAEFPGVSVVPLVSRVSHKKCLFGELLDVRSY